jgi:hypothetical protein
MSRSWDGDAVANVFTMVPDSSYRLAGKCANQRQSRICWQHRIERPLPVRVEIRSPKNDDFAFKCATNRAGKMVYDLTAIDSHPL